MMISVHLLTHLHALPSIISPGKQNLFFENPVYIFELLRDITKWKAFYVFRQYKELMKRL